MVTLDPAHPVVRAAAEGMANDAHMALVVSARDHGVGCVSWDRSEDAPYAIEAHARMLCDFALPATRDYWVRWGKAAVDAYHDKRLLRVTAEWWTPEQWAAHVNSDRRMDRGEWEDNRDNPESLSRAVVAALSSSSPE